MTEPAQRAVDLAGIVRDERGQPLVLFHGTQAEFEAFDLDCARDLGMHFGTLEQARHFAGDGGRIIAVHLVIERPLRLRDTFDAKTTAAQDTLWQLEQIGVVSREQGYWLRSVITANHDFGEEGVAASWAALREAITAAGYDGVVYENDNLAEGEGDSWIVFRAEQIQIKLVRRLELPRSQVLEP